MTDRGPIKNAESRKRKMQLAGSERANLRCPSDLDDTAQKFWREHAKRLSEADLLSPADIPSFKILCQTYSLIQQVSAKIEEDTKYVRHFQDLTRQYLSLAKQFCLFPVERRKQAITFQDSGDRHEEKPEFEF